VLSERERERERERDMFKEELSLLLLLLYFFYFLKRGKQMTRSSNVLLISILDEVPIEFFKLRKV